MSKGSRKWKASCKEVNRLTNGTSWSKKDMTLSSYRAMKREDQRWLKIESPYLKRAISELDAGKGIKTISVEHDGIGHPVILEDGDMKSEITVSIGS